MRKKGTDGYWVAILLATAIAARAAGKPGEGLQTAGDVLLRPFVDAAASYDDNPLLLPHGDETDDFFIDVCPGINATRAGELLRLEGLFWSRFRRFNDLTGENRDDWSEELRAGVGNPDDWRIQAYERFGRVSDYDLSVRTMDAAAEGTGERYLERPSAPPLSVMERSERVDRDILDCGVGLGGP